MNMRKSNEDFSRFGKHFQESMVQLMLEDRAYCDQITEVLDVSFFELSYLQVFVGKLLDYRKKYKVHPTYKAMITILRTELESENEALQMQVKDFFSRIHTAEITDREFIKDTSLDFCRKQKLKAALMKTIGLMKSSSYDEISKVINDALTLGMGNEAGYEYLTDFEERYQLKARNPQTTGWDEIDSITAGGLGQSELGVVVAPTGAGKSMVLTCLGAKAIQQGKTVVHYTFELCDKVIGRRYDSCITQIPLGDLNSFKEQVYEEISELTGSLIIKEYPTKSASTQTLKTHLEKLKKRGVEPDMIIVDYADLLKPVNMTREKRHDLENIYEELRGIAQENECPLWTASQTNRSGLNAEVVTMEAISEAFNKCFVADFICSVSRTAQDKVNNTGRMFVAKNRNGPDGMVYPLVIDWKNVKMQVLPESSETMLEIEEKSLSEHKADLYKRYKNNKEK
ncbi:MAG: putative ATP-dependent helicase [Prokaryotic dsDNA virus sp.]|nr:MAG: putative ATP-dependent helicase [Prokaryotic dsDNA virus sp.]